MTQHVADRLLAAIVAQLQAAGLVVAIDTEPTSLPGVILENIEDKRTDVIGRFPSQELRQISLNVFCCDKANSDQILGRVGELHFAVHNALLGSQSAKTLSGVLVNGLDSESSVFRTDTERLEQPIAGWSMQLTCFYSLRSDRPGLFEKEST